MTHLNYILPDGCDDSTEFSCKNGYCIPQSYRCDTDNDCSELSGDPDDISDEENCSKF